MVAIFEQFDSNHRAQPAYVANLAVGFRNSQQAFTQGLPQIVGFLQQIFLLENVQYRQRGGTGNWVTGIGTAQTARWNSVHDVGATGHACQREAAGDGFGEGGEIGRNAHLLHGKQRTGAARTALYFISNQHDPVFVTNGAQTLHKSRRSGVKTPLALNGFNYDGGDVFRRGIVFENAVNAGDSIVVTDAVQRARVKRAIHVARHQPHSGRVWVHFPCQRQGVVGTAVVSTAKGDGPGTFGGGASDFYRVFHRFGAGGD